MHRKFLTDIRWLGLLLAALSLLLGGCTSTVIRSNVTAFHQWPQDLQGASFVFEPTAEQKNDLEYATYENLVRAELERHGLRQAGSAAAARLKVRISYSIEGRDVRIVQPALVGSAYPWYGPYWRSDYGPFYDPFWFGPHYVQEQETRYVLYKRQLKVTIASATDGKNLYQVTVNSEGSKESLAAVMPYMVRSAFAEFPGQSGIVRQVDLKMEK